MTTAALPIADLTTLIDAAIADVRTADRGDGGMHRDAALRLIHCWVAQQDRLDPTPIARRLDVWCHALNEACWRSGSATPVVRVGQRLRTAR